MGVRIIEDREDGSAVFYCSNSMWAFGPVFEDRDEAEAFLEWYGRGPDIRLMTDKELEDYVWRFRQGREAWEAKKRAAEAEKRAAEETEYED